MADTGSLYADLVLALRAENGAPILKKYDVPATTETEATTEYCVQPVSYVAIPGITPSTNPVDGRQVWVVPLQGEWLDDVPPPIPLDEIGACDPQPADAMFVKEVDLERLNLTRTSAEVIAGKLADVQLKLQFADAIALESTGRLSFDGTPIDASPENAAIYQSLMLTGTIPGLPATMAGPPATVPAAPGDAGSNSQFDAWELAAMTIGAAASKNTPINIDTIEYYNRIVPFPPDDLAASPPVVYQSPWGVKFVQSVDPGNPGSPLAGSERFVDYSGFSYNRSETFKGSVTWLDVPTLTWKVAKITDVVPFTNLSDRDQIGTSTLQGVTAFAQLADDVRALCNFIPDNTFLPGFAMDVPGVDTTAAQEKAIHDPAVEVGPLPDLVFQTVPFQATASLRNPWGGVSIPDARLRLTVEAPDALAQADVVAKAADGQSVPFSEDGSGRLVGWWGPATGFPVAPGYSVSTTFDVIVGSAAPRGAYHLTLELVTAGNTATVLAKDAGVLTVSANVATVLWGEPVTKYATQGTAVKLPVVVYSPAPGTGSLTLTVTPATGALKAGDVSVYGSTATDMVAMPLALNAQGGLEGRWEAGLTAGDNPVTLYATVAEGALVTDYAFGVRLDGGNAVPPAVVAIFAPETHGEQPPGSGEDTTPPVVTITSGTVDGTTATLAFIADDEGTTFECQLSKDGVDGTKEACTSPKTYTALGNGSYVFSVTGTNRGGLTSAQPVTHAFTIGAPPADTTPPIVTITAVGTPGSTARFTLGANEPATFACQLLKNNGPVAAWAPCTSPVTYSNLRPATYNLSVKGTDAAGNESAAITSDPWTVAKGGGRP